MEISGPNNNNNDNDIINDDDIINNNDVMNDESNSESDYEMTAEERKLIFDHAQKNFDSNVYTDISKASKKQKKKGK